jgi:hypothetical protein
MGPGAQDRPRAWLGVGFIVTVSLIAFVAGSIVTMAVTTPFKAAPEPAPATTAVTAAPPTQPGQPTQPRVPLSNFLSETEYGAVRQDLAQGKTAGSVTPGQAPAAAIPATSNPNIPNPEPWQYDPVANKHYDPDHGHWHLGQPPSVTNPEPWQYDPNTNKFWHPGHNHWHDGQPPPPDQRDQ